MQPMLQIESRQGSAVAEFFDDGRNHHRVEAHRVASDDEKCKLPSQAGAEESVVEAGVRDGWGIVAADDLEHKEERRENEKAPDAGDPENCFSEFHGLTLGAGKHRLRPRAVL